MDRHFSSSLGIPMIVHDSDVTALIDSPTQSCQRNAMLSLRVRLSRLLSTILGSRFEITNLRGHRLTNDSRIQD